LVQTKGGATQQLVEEWLTPQQAAIPVNTKVDLYADDSAQQIAKYAPRVQFEAGLPPSSVGTYRGRGFVSLSTTSSIGRPRLGINSKVPVAVLTSKILGLSIP
jgi:hypothetical protein